MEVNVLALVHKLFINKSNFCFYMKTHKKSYEILFLVSKVFMALKPIKNQQDKNRSEPY